jgi:hypothetical protein
MEQVDGENAHLQSFQNPANGLIQEGRRIHEDCLQTGRVYPEVRAETLAGSQPDLTSGPGHTCPPRWFGNFREG